MKAKIINEETKEVSVALGSNPPSDYVEMEVEQAYNFNWYVKGYAPEKPAPTKEEQQEKRHEAYVKEVDGLHAQKMRHEILGDWTEEDEAEYREKVIRLSEEIAERYPYPTDPIIEEPVQELTKEGE